MVMTKMKEHSSKIVEQAQMVSTELIRAAILWHEMWYDGLEEASKYYFADGNIPGMFEVLEPLHEMVENVSLPSSCVKNLLTNRVPRHYEKLRLFRVSDTTCVLHESIWLSTLCIMTIPRFNRHGISTML